MLKKANSSISPFEHFSPQVLRWKNEIYSGMVGGRKKTGPSPPGPWGENTPIPPLPRPTGNLSAAALKALQEQENIAERKAYNAEQAAVQQADFYEKVAQEVTNAVQRRFSEREQGRRQTAARKEALRIKANVERLEDEINWSSVRPRMADFESMVARYCNSPPSSRPAIALEIYERFVLSPSEKLGANMRKYRTLHAKVNRQLKILLTLIPKSLFKYYKVPIEKTWELLNDTSSVMIGKKGRKIRKYEDRRSIQAIESVLKKYTDEYKEAFQSENGIKIVSVFKEILDNLTEKVPSLKTDGNKRVLTSNLEVLNKTLESMAIQEKEFQIEVSELKNSVLSKKEEIKRDVLDSDTMFLVKAIFPEFWKTLIQLLQEADSINNANWNLGMKTALDEVASMKKRLSNMKKELNRQKKEKVATEKARKEQEKLNKIAREKFEKEQEEELRIMQKEANKARKLQLKKSKEALKSYQTAVNQLEFETGVIEAKENELAEMEEYYNEGVDELESREELLKKEKSKKKTNATTKKIKTLEKEIETIKQQLDEVEENIQRTTGELQMAMESAEYADNLIRNAELLLSNENRNRINREARARAEGLEGWTTVGGGCGKNHKKRGGNAEHIKKLRSILDPMCTNRQMGLQTKTKLNLANLEPNVPEPNVPVNMNEEKVDPEKQEIYNKLVENLGYEPMVFRANGDTTIDNRISAARNRIRQRNENIARARTNRNRPRTSTGRARERQKVRVARGGKRKK